MISTQPLVLESPRIGAFDLSAWERGRVLAAGDAYVRERPVSIVEFPSKRSAGGRNDFHSEGDYWWPDPSDPDGPYVRRDGLTNPDNFNAHRETLRRMSIHVPALAAAHALTGDARYARAVEDHLEVWFVDRSTRMTPHLQYGQAIHGVCTGRGIGIVDTIHLAEVAVAVRALANAGALNGRTVSATRAWFAEYMNWMRTSQYGIDERDHGNNHTTCWVLQVAAFAALAGDGEAIGECRDRFRTILLMQMAADGGFPQELERTRPYNYSIFNLDMMTALCQLFAVLGKPEWTTRSPAGLTIRAAMEFLLPALADKSRWKFPPDVSWFDAMPVRSPMLLFGAFAFDCPEWLETWKGLDPDPRADELVRNHPMRQPLLWYMP